MMRLTIVLTVALLATPAAAIDICSGGNRADRGLTCVVDGDTGWERGVKWRMLGIDTPETFEAECDNEKAVGYLATDRLRQLMSKGYRLENDGEKDRTSERRDLVRVILDDGRDAGDVLVEEGLAQPWPNKGNKWCGR